MGTEAGLMFLSELIDSTMTLFRGLGIALNSLRW